MTETPIELRPGDALLVVDVQNDFLPGGSLAVPDGDIVVPVLNDWIAAFRARGLPVIYTRDWHPAGHCSFVSHDGPWPPHCIAGSFGADFAPGLSPPRAGEVVSKATSREAEDYSGFDAAQLAARLREAGATRLFVGGLATDYCILATVEDARRDGFDVQLIAAAVRAVDVQPGDGERALGRMAAAGAQLLHSPAPSA